MTVWFSRARRSAMISLRPTNPIRTLENVRCGQVRKVRVSLVRAYAPARPVRDIPPLKGEGIPSGNIITQTARARARKGRK